MFSIFLSLLCSVSVGILLKIAKQNNVHIFQITSVNYLVAVILSWFLFNISVGELRYNKLPLDLLASLWVLLPIILVIQVYSLKYVGIVKTDIAQRLSLFISLIAAYFLFDEVFTTFKLIGSIIAFIAIFFTLNRIDTTKDTSIIKWFFPIFVLFGFGVIDVLFKMVASYKVMNYKTILFVVFLGAFFVSIIINLYLIIAKKNKVKLGDIPWGIGLGVLNFGNIYFYLKAHEELAENPSTVFAIMNMGVIILGSLVGVLIFKEKMTSKNYFGIFLALIAVVIIMISQVYGK